jgi:hypothetical protein
MVSQGVANTHPSRLLERSRIGAQRNDCTQKRGTVLLHLVQNVPSIEARHGDIQQDHIVPVLLLVQAVESIEAINGRLNLIVFPFQELLPDHAQSSVIVNNDYELFHFLSFLVWT